MHVVCRLGEPFWRAARDRRVVLEIKDGATVADALAQLGTQFPDLGRLVRGVPPKSPAALGPLCRNVRGPLPVQVFVNRRVVR